MSTQTKLFIALGLLITIVGLALFISLDRNSDSGPAIAATVNRDCAPWDGSAFTVTVPLQNMSISVSIYQAPDIKHPTSFLFPDKTQQVGSALLIMPLGSPEPLKGNVSFQRVAQDLPVEGKFDLVTNDGQRFKGRFIAEWRNEVVLCG